mmetsp:Transcript_11351/g.29101  ORF Transcript_11351/g.29101 Transcript_11351/m.29101 type:complete len:308 (-) Transcript_11351:233-1156(-)
MTAAAATTAAASAAARGINLSARSALNRIPASRSPRCAKQVARPLAPPARPVTREPGGLLHRGRRSLSAVKAVEGVDTRAGLRTVPWTGGEAELKALAEVQARLEGYKYGTPSADVCKWFLRDRKFDVEETVEKLQGMLRWRSEFRVDAITDAMIAAEAATGKAELWRHCDVNGQPVVLVRVDKHVTGKVPLDESIRLCVAILEEAESQAVESGVETILGIFDLKAFNSSNADFGFAKFLVDAFFTYYPKRLSQVLFVDAPWIFQPAWAVVKPWLGKYAALVKFVSAAEVCSEYFAAETCPADFQAK